MSQDESSGLSELATAIAGARVAGLTDVYLERRADTWWHLADGRVGPREILLREGSAVRRDGALVSTDGLERPLLARLLGITSRALPQFSAPAFPEPPSIDAALPLIPQSWASLRWSWRWSAVLTGKRAVATHTPRLAEITFRDGHRSLTVWPPQADAENGGELALPQAHPRSARPHLLFAPAASAVLVHELVGHRLEADAPGRRPAPDHHAKAERLFDLPLRVVDDPTRTDLPGSFSADDEGEPGRLRELLVDGVVAGLLADRESAAALGIPPGNARRANVHCRPRPRISNLVALAGDLLPSPPLREATVEVAALDSGTLEPASGAILLRVRTAYALRRGERSRRLTPFTLVGTAAALRTGLLAAAAPAAASSEPGWCAKDGEVVPTGAVAPWLLLSGLEVR